MRHMSVRESVLAVGFGALLLGACSAHSNRGTTLYQEGRYIEAAEIFERTEYRLKGSGTDERAEYALYRGLTLLKLGDLPRSRQWLSYAYQIERRSPDTLGSSDKSKLRRAWAELEAATRQQPVMATSGAVATTAPAPAPATAPVRMDGNGQRSIPPSSRAFVPR